MTLNDISRELNFFSSDMKSQEKIKFTSFTFIKVLGQGSFGKVFLAKKNNTENYFAIKALKKKVLIQKK
jgi:serine/threonine protein kinase